MKTQTNLTLGRLLRQSTEELFEKIGLEFTRKRQTHRIRQFLELLVYETETVEIKLGEAREGRPAFKTKPSLFVSVSEKTQINMIHGPELRTYTEELFDQMGLLPAKETHGRLTHRVKQFLELLVYETEALEIKLSEIRAGRPALQTQPTIL